MILTKDNILRFVRERKYVTPSDVSKEFDTSTMIASAALSEVAKENLILITNLKLASSPFYYDPKQKAAIEKIGEENLSGNDKNIFLKLREQQVINDNSLTIQERIAIERIKDFAFPITVPYQDKELKFWLWFLRDKDETKKQILDVLNPKTDKKEIPKVTNKEIKKLGPEAEPPKVMPKPENFGEEASKEEHFIEHFFSSNYLKVESKNRLDKTINYKLSLKVNKLKILFDCIYFEKKPTDAEVLNFYTLNNKPKIVFVQNAPKKLFKLADSLDNLTLVNI